MARASIQKVAYHKRGFMLAEIAVGLLIAGLAAGSLLAGHELAGLTKLHAQVSQLARFDEAVDNFHEKFDALPGDILAASAERQGLPAGDGTPAHSDGDGKISPCNSGWQWHLGCETALFWAQLSATGYIEDNFKADARLEDKRIQQVGFMAPYLPQSPMGEDVYVAIWSSSEDEMSPEPRLRYGNYYEISKISGIEEGKFIDNSNAISPLQAQALDKKIDDGFPLSGRVVANGSTDWPNDAWGSLAKPGTHNCVNKKHHYNVKEFPDAGQDLCHLAVALETYE
jgi:hypothetical protein